MYTKQHTIKTPITVSGVGLHTGCKVNLTFKPDEIDSGIKFKRVDLPGQPVIEADADLVVEIGRAHV